MSTNDQLASKLYSHILNQDDPELNSDFKKYNIMLKINHENMNDPKGMV